MISLKQDILTVTLRSLRPVRAAAIAAALSSCADVGTGDPGESADHQTPSPNTVTLFLSEEVDSGPRVRTLAISADQAEEIRTARAEKRDIAWTNDTKTVGSLNWEAACQWWDWTVVSAPGKLFCARKSSGPWVIQLPFRPDWISPSATDTTALCTSARDCYAYACGGASADVWRYWFPGSVSSQWIAPPVSVRYVSVGEPALC